jgi:hypothetical protein
VKIGEERVAVALSENEEDEMAGVSVLSQYMMDTT